MRCIFCKSESSKSRSVEHIIPESLGNTEHVLPSGIVCDNCNNYFARKIEKPLLESQYFLYARFENLIQNKKKKVPTVKGVLPKSRSIVDVEVSADGIRVIVDKKDIPEYLKSVEKGGTLYILHPKKLEGNQRLMSRFLGKAALETLAQRAMGIPNAIDVDIIDHAALDELREYVRYDKGQGWNFYQRELYPADAMFYSEEDDDYYDIPNEYTLLFPDTQLYFVVAIFGIEYVINVGDPDISGYQAWLKANNNKSPLYTDGISYSFTRGSTIMQEGSIIEVCTRE